MLTPKVASLDTLTLTTWQLFETYQPLVPMMRMAATNLNQLLPQDR